MAKLTNLVIIAAFFTIISFFLSGNASAGHPSPGGPGSCASRGTPAGSECHQGDNYCQGCQCVNDLYTWDEAVEADGSLVCFCGLNGPVEAGHDYCDIPLCGGQPGCSQCPASQCTVGSWKNESTSSCPSSSGCTGVEAFECVAASASCPNSGVWYSDGTCYENCSQPCGTCSASCGGGTCSTSGASCNTQACPPPSGVTCGECTVPCGGGLQGCSDGVARACNTQPCGGGSPPPYGQGYYYGQGTYCTPAWGCETPYNGFENDGCGSRRANASCNPAFIQAGGASVHSNASIIGMADSAFPAGAYFNPGQSGVVSSMGAISFSPGKTNTKQWQLTNYPTSTTPIHTNPRYDHDYFWNLYKNQVSITVNKNDITNGDLQVPGSSDPEIIAIHPISGNTVRLKTPGNITGGKLTIVFVNNPNGTPVNFSVDSRVQVDSTSFVIFIVSGNVTIDSTVDQADGYYLSTGSYNSGSGATQLNVSGGVAAYGGVNLGRRNSTTTLPSEVFTYNGLITKFATKLGESAYSWTETIP